MLSMRKFGSTGTAAEPSHPKRGTGASQHEGYPLHSSSPIRQRIERTTDSHSPRSQAASYISRISSA